MQAIRASAALPLLDNEPHCLRRVALHLPARRSRQNVNLFLRGPLAAVPPGLRLLSQVDRTTTTEIKAFERDFGPIGARLYCRDILKKDFCSTYRLTAERAA
jgi:hypothetical protein